MYNPQQQQQQGPDAGEPYYGAGVTEEENPGRHGFTIFKAIKLLLIACTLAFSCLILYCLFGSGSTSAIQSACGGMWELLLARVLISIFVGIVLGLDHWGVGGCHISFLQEWWGVVFFCVYFFSFSVAEIVIIPKGMIGNALCVDTLSNHSFTGTPLLGILGFIHLGIDCCLTVMMAVIIVFAKCYNT